VLDAAWRYVRAGCAPGGSHANRRFLAEWVEWEPELGEAEQLVLCDAQTSGGMLIAVAPDRAPALRDALAARGAPVAAVVGELRAGTSGRIHVARRRG
jgi:selenide,water dikinase